MSLPPFPMPFPDRKLKITWREDGLAIIAASHGSHHQHRHSRSDSLGSYSKRTSDSSNTVVTSPGAFIKWGRKSKVESVKAEELLQYVAEEGESLTQIECFGIVGILRLFAGLFRPGEDWMGQQL